MGIENTSLYLMKARAGLKQKPTEFTNTNIEGIVGMGKRLSASGGLTQQERMIRDKRKTLNEAVLYSYQGAFVQRLNDDSPIRALINPNKLKQDYDDKVISIGYESGFKTGDVFEWCNTHTHWLIYLQDLTELAYFRGDIRKCSYEISWQNNKGEKKKTYVALRGPVETRLNSIQKHSIIVDNPNYSLRLLIPKNEDTLEEFQRYSKFYVTDNDQVNPICWRVEAVDIFSTPGIIEVNAVEYYSNEHEDDLENGIAGGLIVKPEDPNKDNPESKIIIGETFIKPKIEYIYYISDKELNGSWYVSNNKLPILLSPYEEEDRKCVKLKWSSSYSGQFDLWYGDKQGPLCDYKKTIVVESLF